MFIDRNGMNLTRSVSDNTEGTSMESNGSSNDTVTTTTETTTSWGSSDSNDPGYAPISPNTPSWGPPSSVTSPGYAPISPNTPSWGPPSSVTSPGYAPISPNTPSWGPPSSITGSGNNNSGNNSSGNNSGGSNSSNNNRPVIIIPGQNSCWNCNSGSTGNNSSSSSSSLANVRFLHAAVNQPAVNIRLGNRRVINNMQYGNATPYYLDDNSQSTLVTVTNTQNGRTLFQRYINFSGGNAYTVSIINDGNGISLFTVTDTPCNYRNSGCLRAVNLSPNSGYVDIFLSRYGRIFQSLGQLDATGYNAVQRGSYRVSVSEALPCSNNNAVIMGNEYVECNNTRIAIMDSTTLNVMSGVTYTLYIIGLAYQFPSLQILALESDLVY